MTLRSVVVVGGGLAGVSTASELRKRGYDGRITVLERGGVPYDRPPLSKSYLDGSKNEKDIALQPEPWYDDHDIDLRLHTEVESLRASEGCVVLGDGIALPCDRVVLATGGSAARPSIPGADDSRVHVLRTTEDADRLRAALDGGKRLLVVGAGLIGAEAAATALALGCDVSLVDPVARPLEGVVGRGLAEWLHSLHTSHGSTVIEGGIAEFGDSVAGLEAVLTDGHIIGPFDAVLLGVGMRPETRLATTSGLLVEGGVVVDEAQRTSNPAILAVGDPTRRTVDGLLRPRAEHWEAAQLDGARAASQITGTVPPVEGAPWFWSDRYGRHVEVVGKPTDGDTAVVRGEFGSRSFSVLGLRGGVVVGAASVDDPTTIRAARRLIDRRTPVEASSLEDPNTDLRKMLRGLGGDNGSEKS